MKFTFMADPHNPKAMRDLMACVKRYGQVDLAKADVLVIISGDGGVIRGFQALLNYRIPVFGLKAGHVGALLNEYSLDNLPDRVEQADEVQVVPLQFSVRTEAPKPVKGYAYNDVVVLRDSPQAARLHVVVQEANRRSRPFLEQTFLGDGLVVPTNIGSSGYFAAAGGRQMPGDMISMQSICSKSDFHAVVASDSKIYVRPLEATYGKSKSPKRPVCAEWDGQQRVSGVRSVTIQQAPNKMITLLKERKLDAVKG